MPPFRQTEVRSSFLNVCRSGDSTARLARAKEEHLHSSIAVHAPGEGRKLAYGGGRGDGVVVGAVLHGRALVVDESPDGRRGDWNRSPEDSIIGERHQGHRLADLGR